MLTRTVTDNEDAPLVSVVISCYNQAHFLSDTVTSIVKQTYKNWECIIVNDGSTDNTGELSKRLISEYTQYSICLVQKENGGLARARNAGIATSNGTYILPLDANDMLEPTMIEKCVALLESQKDIAIAYTSIQQFGASHLTVRLREYDLRALCQINFLTCAALFRREAFDAVGGYNTNMIWGYEDWDFWIGCAEKGFYGLHIPEPLFLERIKDVSTYGAASQYDKALKAQIVSNHSSLFTQSQIVWAERVIAGDSSILSLPDVTGVIPEFYDPPVMPTPEKKPYTESIKKELLTAVQFHQSGNLRRAAQLYRKILDEKPDSDRINYELANVLYDTGQLFEAIAYYQKTLQLNPGLIGVYNDLGLAYQETGQLDEAIRCYSKALLLDHNFADAYYNLGLVFEAKGYFDEAIKCYQKVIELNPELEDAYVNLGNVYLRKRNFDDAISHYKKALQINPNLAEAYNNLGFSLLEKKQFDNSIVYFKQAVDLNPNVADTYFNLGNAHKELHNFDEAITYYDHALAINPNRPEIYLNKGYIHEYDGHNEDAVMEYEKALELDPDFFIARFARCMAQLKSTYPDQRSIQVARSRYREELMHLRNAIHLETPQDIEKAASAVGSQQPFLLAYQGLDDRELQKNYGDLICRIMSLKYPQFADRPPMPSCSEDELIRVGVVSGFFYSHSNWKIPIKGWVENLNRQRFHLYGYYTGEKRDQETERAKKYCSSFVENNYSFEGLCRRIRNDRLHVLIFPEIGMDSTTVRLAALRLAPVQCASWGHPDTSGLSTIDYYFSSDLMEPQGAEEFYTEQLIRLPNLSIFYTPLDLPIISIEKDKYGLRNGSVIYLCSQSLSKYLPQYDEVFSQIARRVGDCQFIFISDRSRFVTEQFRSRLNDSFSKLNLELDRYLVFLPRLDPLQYNAVNSLSDIFLDSIGWSGCNSTFEAISCNLPIVTLPGDFMRGRHSSAILTMMGVKEMIATTIEEYIVLAARLGQDSDWRKEISEKIASMKHLAYRDRTCIVALENFVEKAVKKH